MRKLFLTLAGAMFIGLTGAFGQAQSQSDTTSSDYRQEQKSEKKSKRNKNDNSQYRSDDDRTTPTARGLPAPEQEPPEQATQALPRQVLQATPTIRVAATHPERERRAMAVL